MLLLLPLVGLLRAPGALLLLELAHAGDPLHDLRVLVLLAAAHPLLLQRGLARHDVVLDLVELFLELLHVWDLLLHVVQQVVEAFFRFVIVCHH